MAREGQRSRISLACISLKWPLTPKRFPATTRTSADLHLTLYGRPYFAVVRYAYFRSQASKPQPATRSLRSSRGSNRGPVVLFSLPNPWFPSGTFFVHDTALMPGEFPCDFTHLRAPGSERASFAL